MKEYKTVTKIAGRLVFVEAVNDISYGEIVEIQLPSGRGRRGRCSIPSAALPWCRCWHDCGINLEDTTVKFLGETMHIGVSSEMLGRVFNGLGDLGQGACDHPEKRLDINGAPINPYARAEPRDFIQTEFQQ